MLLNSRLSLAIAIIGISFLTCLLFLSPKKIGVENLDDYEIGSYVSFSGEVVGQRTFDDFSILEVSGTEVTCKCETFFEGDEVEVYGIVEFYEKRKQVRALRIVEVE